LHSKSDSVIGYNIRAQQKQRSKLEAWAGDYTERVSTKKTICYARKLLDELQLQVDRIGWETGEENR
jgi:hypothetical protein